VLRTTRKDELEAKRTTESELSVMARAATIGLRSTLIRGYSAPPATGIPIAL
jgi:hypothetical protein